MLINTDKSNNEDVADKSVIGYNRGIGGRMSRPLMNNAEEKRVRGLLSLLKKAEEQPRETVEIRKDSVHELVGLVELLLEKKPIVLDNDVSPNEAAEIAGISRTSIMNMLKSGRLKGYEVGAHWRIKRESLLKYLADRESFAAGMAEMDKNGFGLD